MKIERKKNRDAINLIMEGELTIYQVSSARQQIFSEYEKLPGKIALDLSLVSEIDTAGIQLLLFAKKLFSDLQKNLFIAKSNESVDKVLTMLNINHQLIC